jgi:hypothetical protein
MSADTYDQFECLPEYAIILAILRQAYHDLSAHVSRQRRAASIEFFRNDGRFLEHLCEVANLEYAPIQQAVMRQYPELF